MKCKKAFLGEGEEGKVVLCKLGGECHFGNYENGNIIINQKAGQEREVNQCKEHLIQ